MAFEFGVDYGSTLALASKAGDCRPQNALPDGNCDGEQYNLDLYVKRAGVLCCACRACTTRSMLCGASFDCGGGGGSVGAGMGEGRKEGRFTLSHVMCAVPDAVRLAQLPDAGPRVRMGTDRSWE